MNNKGADQTAQMRRLVCAFVVSMRQTGFLAPRPICQYERCSIYFENCQRYSHLQLLLLHMQGIEGTMIVNHGFARISVLHGSGRSNGPTAYETQFHHATLLIHCL